MSHSVRLQGALICVSVFVAILLPADGQDRQVDLTRSTPNVSGIGDTRTASLVSSDPFHAQGYASAAQFFNALSEPGLAALSYQAAAMLDSGYDAHDNRFSTAAKALQVAATPRADSLRQRIQRNPRDVQALSSLATIELLWPHPEEADKLVRRAMAVDDPAYAQQLDALAHVVSESYALAGYYEDVWRLNRARENARNGETERALSGYHGLLNSYRDNKLLLSELAGLYAVGRNVANARRYFDLANPDLDDRSRLLDRARFLETHNLVDAAIDDLVSYYIRRDADPAVADRLNQLYNRVLDNPRARRQIESALPELVLSNTAQSNVVDNNDAPRRPGIVQTSRQSRFGLSAVPWIQSVSITGPHYRYRSNAAGAVLTTHLNSRVGLSVGVSRYSVSATNDFENAARLTQELTRIGVGLEYGDRGTTQRDRAGTRVVTLQTGISTSSFGTVNPFANTTFSYQTSAGLSVQVGLQTSEGTSASAAPTLLQTRARTTSASAAIRNEPNSIVKFSGRFSVSRITGIDPELLTENTPPVETVAALDFEGRVGIRILPWLHAGAGFRQLSTNEVLDLFWAPHLNRRVELSGEYERAFSETTVRWRAGLAKNLHQETRALPFLDGELSSYVSENVAAGAQIQLSRDARTLHDYLFDESADVLTVVAISGRVTWHF